MNDFLQKKRLDRTRQFNVKLRESIFQLIAAGCSHTGLSQSRFVEMCIVQQCGRVPVLMKLLQESALKIIVDQMGAEKPDKGF